jgi:hypothetical protein
VWLSSLRGAARRRGRREGPAAWMEKALGSAAGGHAERCARRSALSLLSSVPRCFIYLNRPIDVRLRALFIPSVHISFSIVYIGFLGNLLIHFITSSVV